MIAHDYPADCGVCANRLLCPICNPPRTEEQVLRQQLAELMQSYRRSAQPIIDRLVAIEVRKPPKPVIIWANQINPEKLRRLQSGEIVHGDITAP